MKYAIYDKASNSYLTKMVFEVGYSEHTQFECGLNEYITKAELLDTKEAANLAITRIEGFKCMEKGRFVVHSFDETLGDQYIISEAGTPTKVVDNITVDLDGTINVKYGVMPRHWSCSHLSYAVNRLNRLQEAVSPKYGALRCTFDIYKVITITDERSCTHYQFINVTEKCLDFEKEDKKNLVVGKNITDITDPLNKRIEELEKDNYDLGEKVVAREAVANRLQEEKDKLEAEVESIKKEARKWKTMYESALTDNNFSCISAAARELLKDITDITRAKKLANDIIDICEADDEFEVTLKKFSQLYEAVNNPSDDDDTIMYAFKGVLEIFSSLEDHVRKIIDESVVWKNKAIKAEKALNGQKALNKANTDVIEHMRTSGADWKRRDEEGVRAYTKCNDALGEWKRKCKAKDADYEMLKNKLKACEIILESTQSSLTATIKERDDALEKIEQYKRLANCIYGISAPVRCNGKQMFYDITTGKKILVDKEKYDNLVEGVNTINTTYDILKCADCTMDKPSWFEGIINRIEDLTK